MKIILMILGAGSCWANAGVKQHPFYMPFGSDAVTPAYSVEVQPKKAEDMQQDIRRSLNEALARMDQKDGSISPRLRSMLNDPNLSVGQIIAAMFERQQSRNESELDALAEKVRDMERVIDGLNAEIQSLMARVSVKRESDKEARRRILASEPKDDLKSHSLKKLELR